MKMNDGKILFPIVLFCLRGMAFAGSATWSLSPSSSDWNTAANWTPTTVPNDSADTATFGLSNTTNISIAVPIVVDSVVFNSGASAFTITVGRGPNFIQIISFEGNGIINNSGVTQNFVAAPVSVFASGNGGIIRFGNSATAGQLTTFTTSGATSPIELPGAIIFDQNASADHGTFINNGAMVPGAFLAGETDFRGSATAAHGTFINNGATVAGAFGGHIAFGNFSTNTTAGEAVFTINGGAADGAFGGDIDFFGTSTSGSATFTCNGGTVSGGFGGVIEFLENSSAENGFFTINGGAVIGANHGHVVFTDDSTAGNATLIANGGP